jgi:tripartite-type tricarboxylate transporter receptor subunit TctC
MFTACASPAAPTTAAPTTQPGQTTAPTETTAAPLNYPLRPIELVVPFAAGGGSHLGAELLSPDAQKYLGQPLNVTTRPGAGGAVGSAYVANARADGYTLLYHTVALPISFALGDTEYKIDDFIGIAMTSDIAAVLAVKADAPFDTADELVEWVKANPGKFTWGFPGIGSSLHLCGANAMDAMGITDLTVGVPYSGTAESLAATLGGHITAVSCFTTSITEQYRSGDMKIIALQSAERFEDFPDVPTFLEQGYDATLTSWRGIFAPSDTPREIIEYLDKAFGELIMSDTYLERALVLGEARAYQNSEQFHKTYMDAIPTIAEIVEAIGLN